MMKFNCCWINLLIIIILLVPYSVNASLNVIKIPNKAFCADEQCSKPIATGTTVTNFISNDPCVLSSKSNKNVTIFSRTENKKLYPLVEINGLKGFFPPNLFRVLRVKVKPEEINVPVQFKCSNKQVTVAKALLSETSAPISEASDTTSHDHNTISFQESPSVPTVSSKNQAYNGFIFAHASAAEAEASDQPSGFAPGHSPNFPSPQDKVTEATSSNPADAISGGGSSSVLENKDPEVQPDQNNALNEAITKDEDKGLSDNESLTEKPEDPSTGSEEYDDEDDKDIDVDSESIEYSVPYIPSLQSSINDKTEAVNIATSTPPLHPSTPLERSTGIEMPVKTPPMPSTGLPSSSVLQPPFNIQSGDALQIDPALSNQKHEKIAATETPKTSESIAVDQPSLETLSSSPTSLNLADVNVSSSQPESSQAEPGFVGPFKDTAIPPPESVISDTSFYAPNESLTAIKSDLPVSETPEKVSRKERSPDSTASFVGDSGKDSTSAEEAAPQNETISISAEAKSVEPDQSQQSLSTNMPSTINETDFSQSHASQEISSEIQQEAQPVQNINFYHPPMGLSQQAVSPVAKPLDQSNARQPINQPLPADQPPSGPSVVYQIQSVPTPSPGAPESLPPPTHSPDAPEMLPPSTSSPDAPESSPPPISSPDVPESLPPVTPPPNVLESLPQPTPSPYVQNYSPIPTRYPQPQEYPPPGAPESMALPTTSPASEEYTPPPPPPPVDPSYLYESLSPTYSESRAPEQQTNVGAPVVTTAQEHFDTTTAPSENPEENKPREQIEDSPETSPSFWDSVLSFLPWSESSVESYQSNVPAPAAPPQPDHTASQLYNPPQKDVSQKDGADVPVCSDGSAGPDCLQESFLPFQIEDLFSNIGVDSLMTRIIAAAVTLLLCIIAYFFFENRRMDGSLVARVNTLERELMVLSKENTLLKDECASNIGQGQLEALLEELKEAKAARADLEEQVASLERDLDEAAEANMELNQMLAQTLENPKGSADDVLASVERLQAQLDGQRDTIGNMTRSISSKNAEIEGLKMQLTECRETISGLEVEVATLIETVANVRREKEDANIAHVEKLQEVQNQLAEALANKVLEESRLGSELSSVKLNLKKTRQIVVAKESEVDALKESFKELKSKGASEETLNKLFDAIKLHAQVEQLTQERDELEDSLRGEADARKRLEDHVRVIEEEVNKLRVNYEEAQKEKAEAQTRLEVLSNYFKEKEAQLKKECELQEVLLAQQRGDENSVLRQVKSLQEEVETYRSQNESLKREILDQERDLKGQIATLEKKSHDNWVSARQAERKLEESRQEASLLRNRLTLVEKNLSSSGETGGVEANGEGGVISPVMGLPGMGPMGALMGPMGPLIPPPPPPIDLDASSGLPPFMFPPLSPGSMPPPPHFIPPLPPPLMAGDRRPPPLGRMSSPPPAPPPHPGHFTPPPPHFDRLDRPSQSPSPTYHRSPAGGSGERHGFRPFAKPNPRKPTDYRGSNLSSGQSNEPMEKTRTNERV